MGFLFLFVIGTILSQPKIFSGQLHYPRIPKQYWSHRMKTIKAMGLNYISTYVFWNFHQEELDQFDFSSQEKNLTLYLQTAKQLNMSVLLRPGPYVNSQWDLGGIPYWILMYTDNLRSMDSYFINRTQKYFGQVYKVIKPYLGTVIKMIQIQNEYGNVGSDINYLKKLVSIWRFLGVNVPFYHADEIIHINQGHWPDANIGINDLNKTSDYITALKLQPNAIIFASQVYPGWFTSWGDKSWGSKSIATVVNQFTFLVQNKYSFNMLMSCGGTNFGFTSQYSILTSYQFDAPVNEQGAFTQKFTKLRELYSKYVSWNIPTPPAPIQVGLIPILNPKVYSSIQKIKQDWFQLQFVKKDNNYTGEWSFQHNLLAHGMGLYRFTIQKGSFHFQFGFYDIAQVFINDKFVQRFGENGKGQFDYKCELDTCKVVINILSDHHHNMESTMQVIKKGLLFLSTNASLTKIQMKKLRLDYSQIYDLQASTNTSEGGIFYDYRFNLTSAEIVDTYLDMSNYGKGYIWINGHNLGRYWSIGPQFHFYLPGVWLKSSEQNRFIILDVINGSSAKQVKSVLTLKLEEKVENYDQ